MKNGHVNDSLIFLARILGLAFYKRQLGSMTKGAKKRKVGWRYPKSFHKFKFTGKFS
jgi:hypothetical protein